MIERRTAVACLAAVVGLAVTPIPTDTVVVGILSEPVSLEPHRATGLDSAAVVVNVCEPLVRQRPEGYWAEPVLATTWATADNRVWTFTLREGVRFHDGSPFDADTVVANLNLQRRERAFPGHATRVGPQVVTITLERPNAALLATLSQPFFALQSPRRLGEASQGRPVGTGPFRFRSRRPGRISLEANPDYWGIPPPLGGIVFRQMSSPDSLLRGLLEGNVDVTSAVSQARIERLRGSEGVAVHSRSGLNTAFLSLNNERPPFTDERVRQAVARALDRESLVEAALGGQGEPARNPLPPSIWSYATRTKALNLDREVARRLLDRAGIPEGFETSLTVSAAPRPYMPAPLQVAERVRDDLAAVGIRVAIVSIESRARFLELSQRGAYDMAIMGWQADTLDPNDFLSALLASESIGTTNRSRYSSVAMDGLLKRGRRAPDPAARLTAYAEAQELFQRDMPWVPLYHATAFAVSRRSLQELIIGPTHLLRYERAWKQE